jgi:hypothetical protein
MFARTDAFSTAYPRINLNQTTSIGLTNSQQLAMGSYVRESGETATLADNQVSVATLFTIDANQTKCFTVNYNIIRDTKYRNGVLTVVALGSGPVTYSDDFVANQVSGITLVVTQTGSTITVGYTSSSAGFNGQMTYSITHL